MDPYEVLGVASDASDEDIKKAFKRLAMEWHPDRHPEDPSAEERFKEINAAYQAVGTADKRRQWQQRRHQQDGFWARMDEEEMAEFAAKMGFGGFGFNPFQAPAGKQRTAPRAELPISLEEAHAGCSKRVTVEEVFPCDACRGAGATTDGTACATCGGKGRQEARIGLMLRMVSECPACRGTGLKAGPPCAACGGRGRKTSVRTLSVEVPAGAEDGMAISSDGMMVVVRHLHHPMFVKLTPVDIGSRIEVDAFDAMLGSTAVVRTLAGEMTVRIPPGTQPGTQFRLAGAGLYHRSGRRGHHVVRVDVRIPDIAPALRDEIGVLRERLRRGKDEGNEEADE
jgi:molecular chaperone DnaJ